MALKTTRWDAAEMLTTPERVAAYLEEAFDDGDPALIAYSLGVAARAKGMTGMAKKLASAARRYIAHYQMRAILNSRQC